MINKIKATLSEKILFVFLICLSLTALGSYILIKDKCFFVEDLNLKKINLKDPANVAIMNIECGNVVIELYPEISPKAVERFKTLIQNGSYDGSAFYKVIKNSFSITFQKQPGLPSE